MIRLLAITRPIHFKRLVQGTLVSRYMIVMWILPILVSIVPFFKGARYVYSQYIGLCTWSIHEVWLFDIEIIFSDLQEIKTFLFADFSIYAHIFSNSIFWDISYSYLHEFFIRNTEFDTLKNIWFTFLDKIVEYKK